MSDLPSNINDLIAAEKKLPPAAPIWDVKSDDRYYVFTVPLIVVDQAITGLQLRAKSSKRHVDRDALCQLEFAPTVRASIPLWRLQWRPFERHVNKAWGPPGLENKTILGTHEHRFEDNWVAPENRMRISNLPAARPLAPDFATLSDFLAFSGQRFKINDIDRIEPPLISQDLFWTPT
jgi:hypothetical protein